jgi:hypothetical protein
MKKLIRVVAVFAFMTGCGVATDVRQDPEESRATGYTGSDELALTASTPDHVAGDYRRGPLSIHFDATRRGAESRLSLSKADRSPLFEMVASRDHVGMSILGRMETATSGPTTAAPQTQQAGDAAALADLARMPEFTLLPTLSGALTKAGISGSAQPASQQLFEMGSHARSMLTKLAKASREAAAKGGEQVSAFSGCIEYICAQDEHWSEEVCACVEYDHPEDHGGTVGAPPACDPKPYPDLRGDPCGNDCLGMCGPKCTCWDWVCGDCAYHWGCNAHDIACDWCYDSYGIDVFSCAVCLTPIAAFLATGPGCIP